MKLFASPPPPCSCSLICHSPPHLFISLCPNTHTYPHTLSLTLSPPSLCRAGRGEHPWRPSGQGSGGVPLPAARPSPPLRGTPVRGEEERRRGEHCLLVICSMFVYLTVLCATCATCATCAVQLRLPALSSRQPPGVCPVRHDFLPVP